jgi:hypothetical protein
LIYTTAETTEASGTGSRRGRDQAGALGFRCRVGDTATDLVRRKTRVKSLGIVIHL